jgi:hypothetical protein
MLGWLLSLVPSDSPYPGFVAPVASNDVFGWFGDFRLLCHSIVMLICYCRTVWQRGLSRRQLKRDVLHESVETAPAKNANSVPTPGVVGATRTLNSEGASPALQQTRVCAGHDESVVVSNDTVGGAVFGEAWSYPLAVLCGWLLLCVFTVLLVVGLFVLRSVVVFPFMRAVGVAVMPSAPLLLVSHVEQLVSLRRAATVLEPTVVLLWRYRRFYIMMCLVHRLLRRVRLGKFISRGPFLSSFFDATKGFPGCLPLAGYLGCVCGSSPLTVVTERSIALYYAGV